MTIDLTALSDDALILAACFLTSPNHKLSFGGDGAEFKITERARAALDELIAAQVAVKLPAEDGWSNREHYRGSIPIGDEMEKRKLNPFAKDTLWHWCFFEPSGDTK